MTIKKEALSGVITLEPIRVGGITIDVPVVLAPMSGVSDLPFRQLASDLGAPMVVSEMIASAELVAGKRDDVNLRAQGRDLSPFSIQLVGCDPHWMGEAAKLCQDLGADVIDINMGCPAKEVTGKQSGSALMRDIPFAVRLIEAVVAAVSVPVTLKMRLGWDETSFNAPELAREAEAAGVQMLTVHGRTRSQFFKGQADWARVRAVKQAVGIPVLVNGDIASAANMFDALRQSGADGVMVGRGSYGAPWLPGRLASQWHHASGCCDGGDPGPSGIEDVSAIATSHVEAMLSHYGTALGLRNARKHVAWYLAHGGYDAQTEKAWRKRLCTLDCPEAVLSGLREFFARSEVAA